MLVPKRYHIIVNFSQYKYKNNLTVNLKKSLHGIEVPHIQIMTKYKTSITTHYLMYYADKVIL